MEERPARLRIDWADRNGQRFRGGSPRLRGLLLGDIKYMHISTTIVSNSIDEAQNGDRTALACPRNPNGSRRWVLDLWHIVGARNVVGWLRCLLRASDYRCSFVPCTYWGRRAGMLLERVVPTGPFLWCDCDVRGIIRIRPLAARLSGFRCDPAFVRARSSTRQIRVRVRNGTRWNEFRTGAVRCRGRVDVYVSAVANSHAVRQVVGAPLSHKIRVHNLNSFIKISVSVQWGAPRER